MQATSQESGHSQQRARIRVHALPQTKVWTPCRESSCVLTSIDSTTLPSSCTVNVPRTAPMALSPPVHNTEILSPSTPATPSTPSEVMVVV